MEKYGSARQATDGNITRPRKRARIEKHIHNI